MRVPRHDPADYTSPVIDGDIGGITAQGTASLA